MKQHAEKQHFEMTLHYDISKTGIYLRNIIVTHLACPTMPLQAKPFRSKNKKGHLDGQDILTTITNKQTSKQKMDTCFSKKSNLKWPPPQSKNTYALIFVNQNYESFKARLEIYNILKLRLVVNLSYSESSSRKIIL